MKLIFPTFARIILGTGARTYKDFQVDLIGIQGQNTNRKLNQMDIQKILSSPDFIFTEARKHVSVVIVEPKDLGFRGCWVDREDLPKFFERATENGLDLCPHETALQLFIQANRLPDWATVAMNPIDLGGRDKRVVFGMMRTKPLREDYAGYSRDEIPILDYDERPIIAPGGPHLFTEEYYADCSIKLPGGTSTDHPHLFIKPE